jgi:hypothetical protein
MTKRRKFSDNLGQREACIHHRKRQSKVFECR